MLQKAIALAETYGCSVSMTDTIGSCIFLDQAEIFLSSTESISSLLHELGHLIDFRSHKYPQDYWYGNKYDQEVRAWEIARELADEHGFEINEDFVDYCLRTYKAA